MPRRPSSVRLKESPKNAAEGMFYRFMKERGWEMVRRGWPDLLCVKGQRVALVEVKRKRGHRLKASQLYVLSLLASRGVECYRWDPQGGFQRITPIVPDLEKLDETAAIEDANDIAFFGR